MNVEDYHLEEVVGLQGSLPCGLASEQESSPCGIFFWSHFL